MYPDPSKRVWRSVLVAGGLLTHAAILWACPDMTPGAPRGSADAQPISITPRGGPEITGQWLAPLDWNVIAIHGAVLPTGEVLNYSYPDSSSMSRAALWNPVTGEFSDVDWGPDQFCSGLTMLPDGRVYVVGGNNDQCLFQGRRPTYAFDAFARTWSPIANMQEGRWYPNAIQMGDGRVMITSGLDTSCTLTDVMEIYTPGVGISVVEGGLREMQLFPRTHILTNGRVAHVGPEDLTSTFDPVAEVWEPIDFNTHGYRDSGTSVLIPGRDDQVMIIGGYINGQANKTCEILDFNDLESGWRDTSSMSFGRAHLNSVILPDKTVLIIGGGASEFYGAPVKNVEMFNPDTETWTVGAAQVYGRMYHSTAYLLADGRVLSVGQDNGESSYKGEIYEPPYLFRSDRPVIDSAPTQMGYTHEYSVFSADADEVANVVMLPLGAVTHSVNTTQRYVALDVTSNEGNELRVTAPPDANHAPRGYYMLFLVKADGVPSEATMVLLGDFEPPAGCEGDANGDNVVDPLDAGYIQARFGCAVGTGDTECDSADVNADLLVDPLDVGFVLARFGACE